MNILSVLRSELSESGDFIPCERVQKHLNETLKAQDGDILRIGVIGGQKGLAQVFVNKTTKLKGGRLFVQFRVQLLDLCFQELKEALKVAIEIHGVVETATEPTTLPSKCVRDKKITKTDPKFGTVREDRYKFGPLSSAQLEPWMIHPYTPGESVLSTSPEMIGLSKFVPSTTKVLRAAQPRIDIFMALPRPKLLDKILQYAASMSIGRVHFFASSRSDKSYFSSIYMRESSVSEALRLGLEQGMRTTPGPVLVSASLKKALEMTLKFYSDQPEGEVRTLIAHPYPIGGDGARSADQLPPTESAQEVISRFMKLFAGEIQSGENPGIYPKHMMATDLMDFKGAIVLALGPEGGFTEEEICTLMTELPSPTMVSLGKDILRCEVALLSMIAQTQMLITAKGEEGKARQYNPALNTCTVFISPPARKRLRLETGANGEKDNAELEANPISTDAISEMVEPPSEIAARENVEDTPN